MTEVSDERWMPTRAARLVPPGTGTPAATIELLVFPVLGIGE